MHERQEMHEEDEDNLQERHSADLQQAQQQPAGASIQSIATQAAAAMAAAMVAQQLLASAAATCGLDLASLSQFAIMAASQSSQQQQQAGAGAPQTPEQLMAAAVAAATFLSHTSQANQLAATASQLQAAGALNPLGQLNSNSSSNSNLNLSLAQAAAILPEDLTTLAEHQHALKLEQHGGGGGGGSATGAVGNANNNAPTLSHLHHQLNLGAAQQANSNQALGLNLVANNLHGHHAASSIGPIRGGARHQQQHNVEQQQQHHHHHQYQRHGSSSSSGGSSATSDTQTHNNSSSSLGAIANSNSNNNNNAHNHHQSHHHQNQNHHHHNNNNSNNNSHGHSHGHPHHQTTRHLLGHHHHSSIQTQQQLLATKGYNPLAVVVGSGQQTEILTPTHLRKAKLMFFYVRYPNSSTLKECFRDVRFNKNNTAQLVKWFSNFREFYYIQMEKFARDAIIDERIRCKEDIVVTYDHELINVLNNHYNKNRHIELPEVFRQVVEETLRHFFDAIHTKRDQEQSWKKAIYKVIARLDQEVPELFKTDAFNEHLE